MSDHCYPFSVEPLPYEADALEPYINTQTMQIHHDRLYKAYVDRLNALLEECSALQNTSLEQMLSVPSRLPSPVRTRIVNFGGGVWNHRFFFAALRPGRQNNQPSGGLLTAIERKYGSFEQFRKFFHEKAMAVFGSGWLWLVKDRSGCIFIEETPNQNCPLSCGHTPLTAIDVWEHAYFLQYLNLRSDYIDNWFSVVNWAAAEQIYQGGCG